jgi:hypothetical protein
MAAWYDDVPLGIAKAMLGGSRQLGTVASVIVFMFLMNLSSNAISTEFEKGGAWKWLPSVVLVVLVVAIGWRVWRLRGRLHLVVERRREPAWCRALIVFLSRADSDVKLAEDLKACGEYLNLQLREDRERFRGGWRMVWEAIAHHAKRLEHVLVIGSVSGNGKGTVDDIALFRHTAVASVGLKQLQVHGFDDSSVFAKGVDFENVAELVAALEEAYRYLEKLGIPDFEIMLDVTSGPKPASLAAGAIAMDRRDRRCEYVSTSDYRIFEYNITYEVGESST